MPTYNTTSCKEVLGKVYRDLQMEDSHWEADAIEWIGEGLEMIGASAQLEQRQEVMDVQNFKLQLPGDLVFIETLSKISEDIEFTGTGDTLAYNQDEVEKAQKKRISRKGGSTLNRGVGERETRHASGNPADTYTLNPGVIHASWERSLAVLNYKAIATDEEGYPLVPDDSHYKEALFWRIAMKLFLRGYEHPQLNYQLAHQQWRSYAGKARTKAKMPDVDEMENFRQVWVQYVNNRWRKPSETEDVEPYGTNHLDR